MFCIYCHSGQLTFNARGCQGQTVLMKAAKLGQSDVVEALLRSVLKFRVGPFFSVIRRHKRRLLWSSSWTLFVFSPTLRANASLTDANGKSATDYAASEEVRTLILARVGGARPQKVKAEPVKEEGEHDRKRTKRSKSTKASTRRRGP